MQGICMVGRSLRRGNSHAGKGVPSEFRGDASSGITFDACRTPLWLAAALHPTLVTESRNSQYCVISNARHAVGGDLAVHAVEESIRWGKLLAAIVFGWQTPG
ncbi:hypothetical protein GCM10027089_35920 [Nocardia thraciensis]